MEKNITARSIYDSKGRLKSMCGVDELNRNHGTTFMYCPFPYNDIVREIIEFDHGIIHGKRTILKADGTIYVQELWNNGQLISYNYP